MTRPSCPDDLELLERSTWSPADPRHAHVATCPRCLALVAELETIAMDEALPRLSASERAALSAAVTRGLDDAHPVPRREAAPARRTGLAMPWPWIGGLAAAATVVAVSLIALQNGQPGDVIERGGSDPRVVQTESVRVEAGQAQFRWSPRPGADRWRLELLGADFSVVRAETLEAGQTTWTLRVDEAGPALAGQPLHWRVVADSAGEAVAESPPEPFELK